MAQPISVVGLKNQAGEQVSVMITLAVSCKLPLITTRRYVWVLAPPGTVIERVPSKGTGVLSKATPLASIRSIRALLPWAAQVNVTGELALILVALAIKEKICGTSGVTVALEVAVAVGVAVKVLVAVALGRLVGVGLKYLVRVGLGVMLAVTVAVRLGVTDGVTLAVKVGVGVLVSVKVLVGNATSVGNSVILF